MIYISFNNQDFLNFVPCWGGAWPSSLRFSQRTEMVTLLAGYLKCRFWRNSNWSGWLDDWEAEGCDAPKPFVPAFVFRRMFVQRNHMRTRCIFSICMFLLGCCASSAVSGWGVWAHNRINRGAVLAQSGSLGTFLYNHADYITEESSIPDVRKHDFNDRAEGARHYLDVERFKLGGIDSFPPTMKDAVAKYGADSLQKFGTLPWTIIGMTRQLTEAFKNGNKGEILFLCADLGHYIGDAHMPLHTSINHDGQLTGQQGVHAMWEAEIPEMFGAEFNLFAGHADYIVNVDHAVWDVVASSHRMADTLLGVEAATHQGKTDADLYVLGTDGKKKLNRYGQPIHNPKYLAEYYRHLNGMVERQMRVAMRFTADIWYTAWVNAGKPDLADLDPPEVTKADAAKMAQEKKGYESGKITGFKTANDF